MAKYTNVGELQKWLSIDYLEDGDSELLEKLLNASESRIETRIQQPLTEFVDDDGNLDPALVVAILMLAATMHANREAVAYSNTTAVPFNVEYMVKPFVKY